MKHRIDESQYNIRLAIEELAHECSTYVQGADNPDIYGLHDESCFEDEDIRVVFEFDTLQETEWDDMFNILAGTKAWYRSDKWSHYEKFDEGMRLYG